MIDQEHETQQMVIEAEIRVHLRELYNLLTMSDTPEAEQQLGFVAEWLAFWDNDKGSFSEG